MVLEPSLPVLDILPSMLDIDEAIDAAADVDMTPGSRAVARLLEYARGRCLALPAHTTLEILERPAILAVPGAAYYAYGMMAWQGIHLPVLDVETLLRACPGVQPRAAPRYALVVAFQRAPHGPVEHGALGLSMLPRTVAVSDKAQCELPTDSDLWPLLALSCFHHKGQAVPILDTTQLFGAYHG